MDKKTVKKSISLNDWEIRRQKVIKDLENYGGGGYEISKKGLIIPSLEILLSLPETYEYYTPLEREDVLKRYNSIE